MRSSSSSSSTARRRGVFFVVALGVVAAARAQDEKPNLDDLLSKQKRACPSHKCAKSEVAVPKRPLKLTSKGACQGLGGGGMSMFSANQERDQLAGCCDVRQACNEICGTTVKQCDEQFESCINTTCAGDEDCERSAGIHKLMLQLGDSCAKFSPGQAQGCQCIAADKATTRRTQILEDVYKKFAPESIDKVGGLVAKADSTKKFASLLLKLVAKYPALVKQVQDPQQAYFDNLMKEAAAKKDAKAPPPKDADDDDDATPPGDVVDLDDEAAEQASPSSGGEL